ncbi:replication protein, partial [Yersinia enterocolitica]
EESKADLLAYLERKQRSLKKNELFLSVSMGTISEETQIPVSTLKVILKELRTANTVILRTSRGRYGSTKIATRKFVEAKILNTVIQNKKDKQVFVLELLGTANSHVETILRRYEDKTVPFHANILKEREKSKHAPIRGANTG